MFVWNTSLTLWNHGQGRREGDGCTTPIGYYGNRGRPMFSSELLPADTTTMMIEAKIFTRVGLVPTTTYTQFVWNLRRRCGVNCQFRIKAKYNLYKRMANVHWLQVLQQSSNRTLRAGGARGRRSPQLLRAAPRARARTPPPRTAPRTIPLHM